MVSFKKNGSSTAAPAVRRRFPPPRKKFFIAFLAELGNFESYETMLFFQIFWGRWRKTAAADGGSKVACKGKFLKKNNLVSYYSKLPNSARNEIKIFFFWRRKTAADGGSGGPAAIFYSNIFKYFFTDLPKKILFQYL